MPDTLVIALVTHDAAVVDACRAAVATLSGSPSTRPVPAPLALARAQASTFVAALDDPIVIQIVHGATLEAAGECLAALDASACLGLCVADVRACLDGPHLPGAAQGLFDALHDRVAPGGGRSFQRSYSDVALISAADYQSHPFQNARRYRVRVVPEDAFLLEAEITALLANYIHHIHANRLAQRRLRAGEGPVTLGVHLAAIMRARFEQWVLSYYTGSTVSSLIKTLDAIASESGALVQRGPSEHALGCASFINWRLYRRAYLMVLTSAMVDELKGTLANLQQSGARGLIVCADAPESKWFGFQATVGSDGDVRRVLDARRIPHVYLDDPQQLRGALETVAGLVDGHDGPVVPVATQSVLESRAPLAEPAEYPARPPVSAPTADNPLSVDLARVLDIVNHERAHLLWQCGALTADEADLTLAISERAGIALCDALSAPGSIPGFRDGRPVPNYLGSLGQYGSSQEVFTFFNTNGRLNPANEQWLFVLKGKLGQIDSPYSDGDHARHLRICQVNRCPEHIGPFADIGLAMPARTFLEAIAAGLAVDPEIRRHRLEKIEACRRPVPDVFGTLPTLPMTPNFFFLSLRKVMEELIASHGYRHAGLYDVGHCGTLGVRWLPRTDPSFSGWYGRGLMGDALQCAAALVTTGRSDVLAIVGDGARQITPDVLPGIVEALAFRGRPTGRNVTIFVLVNNLFSVINTYQERIIFQDGGRQMEVMNPEEFHEHDASAVVGGTRIVRKRLLHFDQSEIRDALIERSRVNLFAVPVMSNNDGLSILDQDNWQYAPRTTKG